MEEMVVVEMIIEVEGVVVVVVEDTQISEYWLWDYLNLVVGKIWKTLDRN